jgi:hypothetical protein
MRLVNRVVPGVFLIAAVGELRARRLSLLKLTTGLQAFAAVRQVLQGSVRRESVRGYAGELSCSNAMRLIMRAARRQAIVGVRH